MTNDLATTQQWLKDHAKTGVERISQEDLPMPMVQLVQKTGSLQLANGNSPKFGNFYYTATKEQYESFSCYFLGAHTEMRPSFNNKEEMQKVYVFVGIDATFKYPFKMIFRSTQMPVAKNFLGSVFATKMPIFAIKVVLTSKIVEGPKGTYAVTVINEKGIEEDMEKLTTLEKLSAKYASGVASTEEISEDGTLVEAVKEAEPVKEEDPSDIPF